MNLDPKLLAAEGNGAIQVDEAFDKIPLIVFLAGPIKIWWSEWESPRHKAYTEWRDAVRVALVKAGCAVYSPHRAIQGRWNDGIQKINDAGIKACDLLVYLTPKDIIAEGTVHEIGLAYGNGKTVYHCPPSGAEGIEELLKIVEREAKRINK